VSFFAPIGKFLLMKKENSFFVYDNDFDLLMKEECDEESNDFRILPVNENKFVVAGTK
jgi:hypothetical protein